MRNNDDNTYVIKNHSFMDYTAKYLPFEETNEISINNSQMRVSGTSEIRKNSNSFLTNQFQL